MAANVVVTATNGATRARGDATAHRRARAWCAPGATSRPPLGSRQRRAAPDSSGILRATRRFIGMAWSLAEALLAEIDDLSRRLKGVVAG